MPAAAARPMLDVAEFVAVTVWPVVARQQRRVATLASRVPVPSHLTTVTRCMRHVRTLREAGQLLLASRLGGVLPGLARIRSIIVAVRKTSGAATEPRHTAMSGAPGLGWISVPGSGGGGLKRSDFVM